MARGATPRRSPGSEQGHHYPKTSPSSTGSVMASGEAASQAVGARVSSASKASSTSRSNADKQLSQIEKSVTHLLVATKQLLEMLTQWSRKQAKETEVSDVYVRLGYEFNLACRAFSAIGMDTADLGPVPDLLRTILEDTLSQDASPQSLDRYLPRIRDIIINLLHGLKRKQAKLRSRQAKEGKVMPPRQGSSGSFELGDGASQQQQQSLEHTPSTTTQSPQKRSIGSQRQVGGSSYDEDQASVSSRTKSPSPWPGGDRNAGGASFSEREASRQEAQRSLVQSSATTSSSLSSFTMQNMPVVPPHGDSDLQHHQHHQKRPESPSYNAHNFPHPPPPLPPTSKQNDAIGMLQRSGELERRASRRFSAYQIQKHLGGSPSGIPVLPPAQNSPIPNRGQDVRESMNAVRLRGPHLHERQRSRNRVAGAGAAAAAASSDKTAASPTSHDAAALSKLDPNAADSVASSSSPLARTPTDKLRSSQREFDAPPGSSLPGGGLPQIAEQESAASIEHSRKPDGGHASSSIPRSHLDKPLPSPSTPLQSHRPDYTPEHSPPPTKDLTLFLQYKSKIKKYVLPEGYSGLTIARLQLAFIEKFAWNTHSNGADLPEIYIQDPVSGIRHELEDLRDVKDRSVLVLNVEVLDEVRKHFDESVGGIRSVVESVRDVIDGHGTSIQRLIDRQQETSKEISRLAAVGPGGISGGALSGSRPSVVGAGGKTAEMQGLREDLASLRQTYSAFSSDIASSMANIRAKAKQVKSAAVDAVVPSFEGGSGAGHARVQAGKKELADESEKLVARVDDLQDLVEDLRKDVVTRGVRPLPRQLEAVGRDISAVTKELKKMQDFLKREKPIWTKIWEKELQLVCEERDQLTMQEDLAVDLEDDLEKATQTFALVEQATKQQALESVGANPNNIAVRNVSRTHNPNIDPADAKDSVLGEVRALQPNHESRLEAIERAEKARQRELESRRGGEFQKELSSFVGANKLKNTGGFEELERVRKEKEESIRREVWERMQGLLPAEPEMLPTNGEDQEDEHLEANSADDQPTSPGRDTEEDKDAPGANADAGGNRDSTGNQSDRRSSGHRSSDTPVSPGKKRSSWLTAIFSS
ncbi:bud site selection protein 6 [Nannizzia gypsea CBS 118893]|uniref:Bud site selection protein 6 n=1 Tax=Arthroderma gypseum (strain ATCC MYA-4604 / CBS 118893) TaxID=535722 RepID=E4V6G7_ARTGP|nr:bud site selection protein 6 [Nannizzia gypsea CBS 118893]EFQ96683.1 bud site selection protein 6 [Nannizzia gypsea CBS 118893]